MRLNIGSGIAYMEGYTNVDIMNHPGIDIHAPADKIPLLDGSVDEILAEHLIEHLTFREFNRTIIEWHRLLKVGGRLTVECPDLLGLCKQFIESNEFGRYTSYEGYWPIIAHLYGHQLGYGASGELAQVHKSGYTVEHLKRVLLGIGFSNIDTLPSKRGVPGTCVLRLTCIKRQCSNPHERWPEELGN